MIFQHTAVTRDRLITLTTEVETLQRQYMAATEFADRRGLLREMQLRIKQMDQLVNEDLAELLRTTAE